MQPRNDPWQASCKQPLAAQIAAGIPNFVFILYK
jgi:hypothetical protein